MSVSVATQHNDNARTGVNSAETILTPHAVRVRLRKLFEVQVDPPSAGGPSAWASQITAQPLFIGDVKWPDGSSRDVLVVCTLHGTVYAFDATQNCALLWARWLGPAVTDLFGPNGQVADRKDIWATTPEWGILSTPVIDVVGACIYVVMWHADRGGTFKLHKLELVTGNETAQVNILHPATSGVPAFDPVFQKQRPGLLLLKPTDVSGGNGTSLPKEGAVYVGFGASIEEGMPYHGWVFAYNAGTLAQQAVWCSTSSSNGGGVWQAGSGLAADDEGNVYAMTGNGDFDGLENFGQSFVKLSGANLSVSDFFTPWNWRAMNVNDNDLGSSGPVWIPGTRFVVGVGKVGILYSLDRGKLGRVRNGPPNNAVDEVQATGKPPHPNLDHDHHVHGSPVYFEPLTRIYLWGENDVLRAFEIDRATGRLSKTPVATSVTQAPNGMPGGMLSLSANGAKDAVLWALMPLQVGNANEDANRQRLVDGVLRAFDPATLQEIWNSAANSADSLGHFAKFVSPTIAKGRVYAPTYDGRFVVYGT